MIIKSISEETKKAIRKKLPISLPDNPSRLGFTALKIKQMLGSSAILDPEDSILSILDRIISEANNQFDNISPMFHLDEYTNEIEQPLENLCEYAYSSKSISKVNLLIPEGIKQGYFSSFSIKISEPAPDFKITNNSRYPLYIMKRGLSIKSNIKLSINQTLIGSVIFDGINVYVQIKELLDRDANNEVS